MKKSILLVIVFSLLSCNGGIEKPKNLIEKDKMIDILYDISLLEAVKSQNINGGITNKNANAYLYKKYKIDSLQLVQSNKYYAADIDEYKKMFEKVKSRLEEKNKKYGVSNSGSGYPPNPNVPQVQ